MGNRTEAERSGPGQELDTALAETMDGRQEGAPAAARIEVHDLRRIGRYFILRPLGQGGMGVVYAAYDEELDRKVALKLLHRSELAGSERRARVLREAQAMARVSHPNVLTVYEVGVLDEVEGGGATGSQIFIAMEFIEGATLHAWQRQEGRTWDEILRMYLAAGQGLHAAHSAGLVHRDFKPETVVPERYGSLSIRSEVGRSRLPTGCPRRNVWIG
jgi:serine/threonine protein kinase